MFFADLNIHSKYSRGAHPDMEVPTLARWARYKGVGLLGTGDFTQPQWLVGLKKFLKPSGRGIFEFDGTRFLLTAEVVCAYAQGGRPRKINHLLLAPHFQAADRIVDALEKEGDLATEACAAVKLSAEQLVAVVRKAAPEALVVPAHVWGPQHSLFSESFGFDRLEEAYGAESSQVKVLETGLCADPLMTRRWSALDGRAVISSSDAHHPSHIGREAVLFESAWDYRDILDALQANDPRRLLGTVEAHPAEDRFHLTGCRACRRPAAPGEKACGGCGKTLSRGVSDRVAALADRTVEEASSRAGRQHRVIPLSVLIADAKGIQPDAESVQKEHLRIVAQVGPELDILLLWEEARLREKLPSRLADAVLAARREDVTVDVGYDGQPGRARANLPPASDERQLKLI